MGSENSVDVYTIFRDIQLSYQVGFICIYIYTPCSHHIPLYPHLIICCWSNYPFGNLLHRGNLLHLGRLGGVLLIVLSDKIPSWKAPPGIMICLMISSLKNDKNRMDSYMNQLLFLALIYVKKMCDEQTLELPISVLQLPFNREPKKISDHEPGSQ